MIRGELEWQVLGRVQPSMEEELIASRSRRVFVQDQDIPSFTRGYIPPLHKRYDMIYREAAPKSKNFCWDSISIYFIPCL